ncbi:MAG TPA: MMPL family transporter, partial [Ktedonobacterales bacterium]|nr:MMPL family transporter [Ktedonobacterales bacterium]
MHARNPITWLTDRATGKVGRWVTLALWLVAAGLLAGLAPKLANLYDNNASSAIGNQESVQAQKLIQRHFPSQRGLPAIIVFADKNGLSDADYAKAKQVSDWLTTGAHPKQLGPVVSIYTVPQARAQLVSNDGKAMTMVVPLTISSSDPAFSDVMKSLRAYTDQFDGHGAPLQVKVTGPAGVIADAVFIFKSTDLPLLLTTIALVLALLIIIYRSPILALIPLVAVGWVLSIVNALLGFVAQAGWLSISQQATSIMTVLLFGAGTDYTIFIASRYREELRRNPDAQVALRTAMRGVGEAITSSAGTVILALLTLLLTTLGLYYSLGPSMAIAIAVMLLGGLTLVPALLAVLGRVAFWPFMPRHTTEDTATEVAAAGRGFWGRVAAFVTRRPVVSVIGSAALLALLALGNIGVPEVFNFLTGFRSPTPSAAGYTILTQHFDKGTLAPFNVGVSLKQGNAYEHLVALDAMDQAVARTPNIAQVIGPTRPDGKAPAIAPAALQSDFAQLPDALKAGIRSGQSTGQTGGPPGGQTGGPNAQIVGLYAATTPYISDDGSTALLQVTLKSDPYGVPAIDTMQPVRDAARQAAAQNGLGADVATIRLAGVTPQLADTRAVSDHDRMIVVPVTLALVALILALLLRSLIAPLYLIAAVTLNFLAALGASAFLFTRIQGDEGVSYAIPVYTFIFLVALGADYTIYLMSRVREEGQRHGLEAGVPLAVGRTGGVITSAGLILAGTFAVLTTLPINI